MTRRGDTTRQVVRWRLAGQFNDHIDSTASAHGTLNQLIDNARLEGTSALQGKYLYFYTGTHSGIEVATVSFVPGSYISFLPTLAATVASGEPYEVHFHSVKVYNDAVQRAEWHGRERLLIDTIATLPWVGNTYEYTLTGITMDYLCEVRSDYVTNIWTKFTGPPSRNSQWRVEFGESNELLIFDKRWTQLGASGGSIRLLGQRKPVLMTLDSDTCEFPVDWVVEEALMYLHERFSASGDTSAHLQRADRAMQRAERNMLEFQNPRPGAIPLRGTYSAAQ